MSNESNRSLEAELERIYNGQAAITKDKLKQALEEFRTNCESNTHGGPQRASCPKAEMKRKITQMLESEIDKIQSETITKEQAKSTLLTLNQQGKEQYQVSTDNQLQSSIKEELKKLNTQEVNVNQARDLLRGVCHKMRPSHGGSPSVLDDTIKHEFIKEYQSKHGTNKINADEVWEMVKVFDKKQHEKFNCCEKNSESKKEKEQKWDEVFNEQYKELFGDSNKGKINEQQLSELAKKMREKLQADCPRQPGKRFCQH